MVEDRHRDRENSRDAQADVPKEGTLESGSRTTNKSDKKRLGGQCLVPFAKGAKGGTEQRPQRDFTTIGHAAPLKKKTQLS